MDKCCTLDSSPRTQRRINGLQFPLNYQQVIGWIVFIVTGALNFALLIEIQFEELKIICLVIFIVLYVCHVASHLTASLIDPSEKELRKLEVYNVPEFDRDVHAHVIENGRCHLCNIHTSSRQTKHCSICNKCVDSFDHHCKWLNNCIGQRNYVAFIACVTTALMISTLTLALCITDIVIFFTDQRFLSVEAQNFINCSSIVSTSSTYCRSSISFLIFLILFCVISSAIGCALLHLCCFHVYISVLGVSTYEYVVRSGDSDAPSCIRCNCCKCKVSQKLCVLRRSKNLSKSTNNLENGTTTSKMHISDPRSDMQNGEANMINFISILINSELDRARKMLLYDKNKIHPLDESGS